MLLLFANFLSTNYSFDFKYDCLEWSTISDKTLIKISAQFE